MDVDNQSEDGEIKKSPKDMDEFSFSEEEGGDTADSLDIKPPQAAKRIYKSSSSSRRRDKHSDRRDRRDDMKERKSSRHYEREERHRDKHKHRSRHGVEISDRSDRSDGSKRDPRDRMVDRLDRLESHRDSSSRHERKDRTTGDRVLEDLRTRTFVSRLLDKRRERRDDPRDIRGLKPESRRDILMEDIREPRELRESREMMVMRGDINRRDMRVEDIRERRSGEMRMINDDGRERRDLRIDERRHGQINDEQQQLQQQQQQQQLQLQQQQQIHIAESAIVFERLIEQRSDKRHKKNHKHDKIRDREKNERERDREHREKQLQEVMDIIPTEDIESINVLEMPLHHYKDPKEMTEQELRKERLLEADREKARRREVSRLELEARRLKRGEKRSHSPGHDLDSSVVDLSDESFRSEHSDDDQLKSPKLNGRPSSDDHNSEQDRSSERHTSDSSSSSSDDEDDEDDEDDDDDEDDEDGDNIHDDENVDDNNSNDSDKLSNDGSNDESDYNNPSPISVDRLAKSDHSDGDSPGHIEINGVSINSINNDPPINENNHDDKKQQPKKDDEDKEKEQIKKKENEIELPPYLPAIQGCRSVEEFLCLNKIEEGTYGVVYRARDKRTEEVVALKRLKMEKEKEGFPITSLREINTLLKAQHPNIVTVREIVVGSNMDKIFIVMDYVEHDLKSLMETMKQKKQIFVPGEIKCLMQQLLRAVEHLHDNWILHRDLKTSNLLLSHRGILKVGDFGLAREYGSPLRQYTPVVVTLWYRAPELLLNDKEYSTPIDMWSVGCIFAELLRMEALFPGKSEFDQLNRIFKELGTPNDRIWPNYSKLPMVQKIPFTPYPVNNLRQRFSLSLSEHGIDLLNKMLTYDPAQRLTAEDALKHVYFIETPLPIDPGMFPTWPAKSELGARTANASPKPPSGGREYKQLGDGDEAELNSSGGFHMGMIEGGRPPPVGGGFHLKF